MSQASPCSADTSLPELQAFFAQDRYACGLTGVRLVEARRGHVLCELDVEEKHLNAMNAVMGGALFTLADFALAVVSNLGEMPTVSVSSTIEYLNAARGKKLTARASVDKTGRNLGYYTVDIHDELGTHVARFVATCYRQSQPPSEGSSS
ncbi:MAG: PaaI family thioesterase [Coriobacteriales bacterium]|jgi:acyl-CoA thioesterase|nr:PaaI family thioesterase [Coriobacteriales bacterium]